MAEVEICADAETWEEIDVFLFSNGQQNSPPRKYHLSSNDLDYWETTIVELARSQYGAEHIQVDLYTLDGKKVNSPLELRNGTAYVTVVPPDDFIPAGYEKYLVKATRSLEKRRTSESTKRNSVVYTTDDKTPEIEMKSDILDLPLLEDIPNQEEPGNKRKPSKTPVKTNPTVTKPTTRRSSTPNSKPTDNDPENASESKKPGSNVPAPPTKKNSLKYSWNSVNKKNLKVTEKQDPSDNNTKRNTFLKKTVNSKLPTTKEKIKDVVKTEAVPLPLKDSRQNSPNTSHVQSQVEINTITMTTTKETTTHDISITPVRSKENVQIIQFTKEEFDRVIDRIIDKVMYEKNLNMSDDVKNRRGSIKQSADVNDQPTTGDSENFITVVNKGDVVNLQLSMEFENLPGVTTETLHKEKSQNNRFITPRAQPAVLSTALSDKQNAPNSLFFIRRSVSTGRFILTPLVNSNDDKNENKYADCDCCVDCCERNYFSASTDNKYLEMCYPMNAQNVKGENQPESFPKAEDVTINNMKLEGIPQTPSLLSFGAQHYPFATQYDGCGTMTNSFPEQTITYRDNGTQTEWNNILLEAKPGVDGKYSFHFPPLSIIKQYTNL